MPLRFVFALHNHQPVGNFDGVFEQAYRDSYAPFLGLIDEFPEIPISLHSSGCLLEWIVDRKPDYVKRLRNAVERGQVEIMGGGFYEPILPMIPKRDRIGQIRTYTKFLEELFPAKIRGMWIPERVWEQNLVSDIATAGIEYTVLDDHHFKQAGLSDKDLLGYYLSEDEGKLLRIFPNSEAMRYLVPWRDPNETIKYLREVAEKTPDAVVICADDGEKFGGWPGTHKLCYEDGWFRRFFTLLRDNRSWVKLCTFAQALDETKPVGTIYLPDCSYREMTEWALPMSRLQGYTELVADLDKDPRGVQIKPMLRGGFWRNFKVKYPETQEMYARMMQLSTELDRTTDGQGPDHPTYTAAYQHLYQAQCNCTWWHGAFGGLYLPHLRNAVYYHLVAGENCWMEAQQRGDSWIEGQFADFNLDGNDEVILDNSRLAAYFNPQAGGSLYELDLRVIRHNLLATLSRRPEVYHESIRRFAGGEEHKAGPGIPDRIIFKQEGLEKQLIYDNYPRKSLIDHFFESTATVEAVAAGKAKELGDFVNSAYDYHLGQEENGVHLRMQRNGKVDNASVRITKEIRLRAGADVLEIRYLLENLPRDRRLHFGIEFNFAGMAAGADDRYFYHARSKRGGQLQTLQNLADAEYIGLVDEWLGLDASIKLSRPGGIWALPIQTVSQSEGGFELVHQSTAVIPHWLVAPKADGKWEVTLSLKADVSRAEKRMFAAAR